MRPSVETVEEYDGAPKSGLAGQARGCAPAGSAKALFSSKGQVMKLSGNTIFITGGDR
jgi:hypothetical protein